MCTVHVPFLPCSCCGLEVFSGSGKEKACIAGRNCSAGISAFELPRLLVWEHIRLRSLRPAASPTQQQNNRAQNNPKVISLSCIHKSTQVSMSTVSFPNLQPPIQSKALFIQAFCLHDVSLLRNVLTWISILKTRHENSLAGLKKRLRGPKRERHS